LIAKLIVSGNTKVARHKKADKLWKSKVDSQSIVVGSMTLCDKGRKRQS
jgi:tRNA-binding EMAP/Myf-like protein